VTQTLSSDARIIQYRGYAHALAAGWRRDVFDHASDEDLAGYADLGLVEAARSFRPEAGASFKTWAFYSIVRNIIQGIQEMSGLPESLRRDLCIKDARNDIEQEAACAAPTSDQNVAGKRFRSLVVGFTILEALAFCWKAGGRSMDADARRSPEDALIAAEAGTRMEQAIAQLPDKLPTLLRLHFGDGKSLTECAKTLGTNKATTSRWRRRAFGLLREILSQNDTPPTPARTPALAPQPNTPSLSKGHHHGRKDVSADYATGQGAIPSRQLNHA
jgi:RNA polymerase sigma factor (sigma-70 family)